MPTPSITLILSPGACSLAPHILLLESHLPFTPQILDTITDKTGAPESLRAINPKMRVPVLILNDAEIITENPAVMTAISQLCPERAFIGRGGLEVVRVYEWMNWLSGTVHGQGFGALWRPERYSDDGGTLDGIRRKGRETVEECYEKIEGDLRGLHAVGEGFTAVDAYLFVFWRWGVAIGIEMKERYPKYAALTAELVKRESVRKALEAEGVKSFVPVL